MLFTVVVSIRYIAVLGFQLEDKVVVLIYEDQFPSAISRYLVSNRNGRQSSGYWGDGFHPLYRGTWFPTVKLADSASANSSFHPLYRGTWFPTNTSEEVFNADLD